MILPQVKERMVHQAFLVEALVVVQVQAAVQVLEVARVQAAQVQAVQVQAVQVQAAQVQAVQVQAAQVQAAQVQAVQIQAVQARVAQVPDLALRAAQHQPAVAHGNVILLAGGMNILMEAISQIHGQSLRVTGITLALTDIWLLMNGLAATGSAAAAHGPILIKAPGM